MRVFTFAILLLLAPSVCFATNATRAVDSAPAYNACDGVFVEDLTASGSYSATEIADGVVLTEPYALAPIGVYSATEIGDSVSLSGPITNAEVAIDSAPAYNACDGAFVEGFTPSGVVSITEIADGVVLESLAFEPVGVVSTSETGHVGEIFWHDVTWNDVNWNHEMPLVSSGLLPIIIINMQ